ncbi:MAG: response regulator transcription factor [Mucilaginibacter sp.]|nr:response regulator transcription factor [Mucilaginibacter sp.]
MVTVLLSDGQLLTRNGLKNIISAADGFKVIGSEGLQVRLIESMRLLQPKLLIIDPFLKPDGLLYLQQLRQEMPHSMVIVMSNNIQRADVLKIFELGIKCYISKAASETEIWAAVSAALHNEKFICSSVNQQFFSGNHLNGTSVEIPELSPREKEIIPLIANGIPDKEIAERLSLSFHTVRTHRKNITRKLGFTLKNAAELTMLVGYLNELI